MWYITSQKFGGNALGLQRVLGLGSYQTAWSWLHKMRHAMVRPDRERLSGRVEVDETFVGGEDRGGKRGSWFGTQIRRCYRCLSFRTQGVRENTNAACI